MCYLICVYVVCLLCLFYFYENLDSNSTEETMKCYIWQKSKTDPHAHNERGELRVFDQKRQALVSLR